MSSSVLVGEKSCLVQAVLCLFFRNKSTCANHTHPNTKKKRLLVRDTTTAAVLLLKSFLALSWGQNLLDTFVLYFLGRKRSTCSNHTHPNPIQNPGKERGAGEACLCNAFVRA